MLLLCVSARTLNTPACPQLTVAAAAAAAGWAKEEVLPLWECCAAGCW